MTPTDADSERARELLGEYLIDPDNHPALVNVLASALTQARANSAAMKWIPCSERMPEPGVFVLAWDGDDIAMAEWDKGDDWWLFDGSGWDTTHWCDLPAPPEGAGP